ncbi:LacI family DNA-binding transcriptional regulator [Geodermatophilus ruber]|uniref:Transcriptional regulator, LacI family n=1 Tax=Geodermatophilus ruber TaxID=504800 RepID=A0A1I4GKD5_9ACTN|nr:LacI family DNA-binding transcriptional regulator [Geodermatophilus ruber]SFL30508.1 transcriptional regulator, LacI family [Geodermatophilus ruber]
MPTTIRDVAEAAGVSITTVSHVLSGRGRIAEGTRRRVEQAVADLAYRPNVHAQQLVTRKSRTVAIQVAGFADHVSSSALIPRSDYFLDLLNGAAEAAAERGYAVILTPPSADAATVEEFAVDGVIVVDPRGDEPLFSDRWHHPRRMVTTGRPTMVEQVAAVVDNDHRAAAVAMLEHLAEQGYRRPALMITTTARSYTSDVLEAYAAWTAARGMPPVVVTVDEPPTENAAAEALRSLLDRDPRPDAVYASAEDLALGVLHEAQRRGLRVPEELGVCSAVDSSVLQLTSPQVTGMFLHPRDIGRAAAGALLDVLDDAAAPPRDVHVPVELFARGSTLRRG